MKDFKTLLNIRKKIKSKKPFFFRQDAHKNLKLGDKWRKPKGLHSKMRLGFKGYRKSVSIGYGSPKITKNLHKSGLSVKIEEVDERRVIAMQLELVEKKEEKESAS